MRRSVAFLFSVFLPLLCSCSLYQSEGRKFLEQHALEYTVPNVFRINDQTCRRQSNPDDLVNNAGQWSLVEARNNGTVELFRNEVTSPLSVVIWDHTQNGGWCMVTFWTQAEYIHGVDHDVNDALTWLHTRP